MQLTDDLLKELQHVLLCGRGQLSTGPTPEYQVPNDPPPSTSTPIHSASSIWIAGTPSTPTANRAMRRVRELTPCPAAMSPNSTA